MTQNAPTITRTDLDWLCIVHRALQNAPTNDTLWAECVKAMRGLIGRFTFAAHDEAHAAHAQYLLNRIASLACDYTTQGVATSAERIKDVLEAIARGDKLDALRLL